MSRYIIYVRLPLASENFVFQPRMMVSSRSRYSHSRDSYPSVNKILFSNSCKSSVLWGLCSSLPFQKIELANWIIDISENKTTGKEKGYRKLGRRSSILIYFYFLFQHLKLWHYSLGATFNIKTRERSVLTNFNRLEVSTEWSTIFSSCSGLTGKLPLQKSHKKTKIEWSSKTALNKSHVGKI